MRRKTFCLVAALALSAGFCLFEGCGDTQGSKKELQGAILIVLDTVRADHLSCYGYGRETDPALSRLAGQGVLFERAVSTSPWTLPSMVALFSAEMPGSKIFDGKLKRSMVESLSKAGIRSAGITEGAFVSRHFGFDRGFSAYVDGEEEVKLHSDGKTVLTSIPDPEGRIEDTFRQAMDWLTAHKEERFFLYIHTYEPHTPYTRRDFTEGMSPGRVGETFTPDKLEMLQSGRLSLNRDEMAYLAALYDGGIRKSDGHVGELLDHLHKSGLRDKTLVVVTSDHGEELGEHYASFAGDHGHSLYDELVLVPLILHNPCDPHAGKRIKTQVRLIDVMPTILDGLGVDSDHASLGKSLLPLVRGEEKRERIAFGGATKVGPDRIFVRWLGYKSITVTNPRPKGHPLSPPPPSMELYDLREDPGERKNISTLKPAVVKDMMGIFSRMRDAGIGKGRFAIPDDMDESLRSRLESLGYIR